MGFRGRISRSTLADANESVDWRIYADFAQVLIVNLRPADVLWRSLSVSISMAPSMRSTRRPLSLWLTSLVLSVGSVSVHRRERLKRCIRCWTCVAPSPLSFEVSDGKLHDVNILDGILPESPERTFYVMDQGYLDFERLYALHRYEAPSLSHAPKPASCCEGATRGEPKSTPKTHRLAVRSHRYTQLSAASLKNYPDPLRRVRFFRPGAASLAHLFDPTTSIFPLSPLRDSTSRVGRNANCSSNGSNSTCASRHFMGIARMQ